MFFANEGSLGRWYMLLDALTRRSLEARLGYYEHDPLLCRSGASIFVTDLRVL